MVEYFGYCQCTKRKYILIDINTSCASNILLWWKISVGKEVVLDSHLVDFGGNTPCSYDIIHTILPWIFNTKKLLATHSATTILTYHIIPYHLIDRRFRYWYQKKNTHFKENFYCEMECLSGSWFLEALAGCRAWTIWFLWSIPQEGSQ